MQNVPLVVLHWASKVQQFATCEMCCIGPQERGLIHAALTDHLLQLFRLHQVASQVLWKAKQLRRSC